MFWFKSYSLSFGERVVPTCRDRVRGSWSTIVPVKRRTPKPIWNPRPIWGFSWRGWVLLAIALALLVARLIGFNLHSELNWWIANTFGPDAPVDFYAYTIFMRMGLRSTLIYPFAIQSAIGAALVVVAVHYSSRRIRWASLALLVAWFVGHSRATLFLLRADFEIYVAIVLVAVVSGGILFAVTRSWIPLIPIAAGAGWETFQSWHFGFWTLRHWSYYIANWTLAMGFLACLSWWARRERLKILRPARGLCLTCGYDLAGLKNTNLCPECGSEILTPTPSPA